MPAKKNTPETTEYATDAAIAFSKLSGTATKIGTAKSGGVYEVNPARIGKSGTPTVVALALVTAGGKKLEVEGESIRAAFDALLTEYSDLYGKELGTVEKATGKPYGNFKTLRSRLISDVAKGFIRTFRFSDPDAPEVVALAGRVAKK